MSNRGGYWFPAKRYGWGWGPPITWQGWAVVVGWTALLIVGVLRLRAQQVASILAYVLVMTLVLMAICYVKGEPPRWRWGDRDSE
jgi:hypothetical protein